MMFKVAFHGGLGNFWNALMTVPEVNSKPDQTSCVIFYETASFAGKGHQAVSQRQR